MGCGAIRMAASLMLPGVVLMACGCSVYHPFKDGEGYADAKIQDGIFEVSYVAEQDAPLTKAREKANWRAAELTLLQGKRYFEVVGERNMVKTGTRYEPAEWQWFDRDEGDRYGRHGRRWEAVQVSPSYYVPYNMPEVTLAIRISDQPTQRSLDGVEVIRSAEAQGAKFDPRVASQLMAVQAVPSTTSPK